MVGRSDKGLFITTGVFTKSAEEEASRDGAPHRPSGRRYAFRQDAGA